MSNIIKGAQTSTLYFYTPIKMDNTLITKTLQTLASNVESTIKEYIDEKITKEDKKEEINTHITVAGLRIKKVIDTIENNNG